MQNSYTPLMCGGRVCRTLRPNDPIKGSGLRVRERRRRYRLGKTRAGSAFNLRIFPNAVRRSSRPATTSASASMRLNSVTKPSRRPCGPCRGRRPTPTSHFFDRLNAERNLGSSNSFSATRAICSILDLRQSQICGPLRSASGAGYPGLDDPGLA